MKGNGCLNDELPGCEERAYLIGSVSFGTRAGTTFPPARCESSEVFHAAATGPLTRSLMSGWHYWLNQMRKGTHVFNS